MRAAVISDVHGNLPALERVLEEIDGERPDAIWCLGDVVGYGPHPVECCAIVAERASLCLLGNHDLLALGKTVVEADFSPDAAAAATWTRSVLTDEARAFLDALEPQAHVDTVDLFHGSARDPVWEYVLSMEAALASLELSDAPVVLVGHSHVPLALVLAKGSLEGGHAPADTEVDLDEGRWLLNPGSVGQPRDGDPRAAWLLLDLDGRQASFRRVGYDVESVQADIRAVGLPVALADRLAQGV